MIKFNAVGTISALVEKYKINALKLSKSIAKTPISLVIRMSEAGDRV